MDKLQELIEVLKCESQYLLLFLRSVQKIEVLKIFDDTIEEVFEVSVCLKDAHHRMTKQLLFVSKLEKLCPGNVFSDVDSFTVQIDPEGTQHHWVIVNRAGSEHDDVLELAKEQCVIPWVSTAYETTDTHNQFGRIFCSLPLPKEACAPFKICINGTFAISSNRRSLKWEAQERRDDHEGKWNKLLIEKCLPYCYMELIKYLIRITSMKPCEIYSCYPNVSLLECTPWECLLKPLYTLMFSEAVVHTEANGGRWIKCNEAVFFPQLAEMSLVKDVFCSMDFPVVTEPDVVSEARKYCCYQNVRVISPSLARTLLCRNVAIVSLLPANKKLILLEYCLSDSKFSNLHGLELLPLVNGTFTKFNYGYSNHVYLCDDDFPHTLLPDKEVQHKLVNIGSSNPTLRKQLHQLALKSCTQLRVLDVKGVAELVEEECNTQNWSQEQFRVFWTWLQAHDLHHFAGLRIVPSPVLCHVLSKNNIIYIPKHSICSSSLESAISKYRLIVINGHIFPFLKHDQLSLYLRHLNPVDVLEAISNYMYSIGKPNLNHEETTAFQSFLTRDDCILSRKSALSRIPIFFVLQNSSLHSINEICDMNFGAIIETNQFHMRSTLMPDKPLVISSSKNNRTFLQKVIFCNLVTEMSELDFIAKCIFPKIIKKTYPSSQIEPLMLHALDLIAVIYSYSKEEYITYLQEVPFITVDRRSSCYCVTDLCDPNDKHLANLYKGEPVFPLYPFDQPKYLRILRECGLKSHKSLTLSDILNILNKLIKPAYHNEDIVYDRACALVEFLNLPVASSFLPTLMKLKLFSGSSWVPVVPTPPLLLDRETCNVLEWKGSCKFSSLSDVVILDGPFNESTLPWILGSSMCFLKGKLPKECVINSSILAVKVLENFRHVISKQHLLSDNVKYRISILTYEYLSSNACTSVMLNLYSLKIWNGKYSSFIDPAMTALHPHHEFQESLEPFVYLLPIHYKKYFKLFLKSGTEKVVTTRQIISVLHKLHNDGYSGDKHLNLSIAILKWIGRNLCSIDRADILIPIESVELKLMPINKVAYPNNDFFRHYFSSAQHTSEYFLTHPGITQEIAENLNIPLLSTHLDISEDIIMEDAGQNEPLLDRLNNILQQYQDCDGYTIVKEMLQNADDAGASEINIVFDHRMHSTESLYYSGMAPTHGPALVIHNNKPFSDEDFNNITKLANSSKNDSTSLKIGKFGIGFCSVYNITDVPSFVSRNMMFIFDPTLKYVNEHVKDKSQPGQKATFTNPVLQGQLSPFCKLFGFEPTKSFDGTIFRLPFRTSPSQLSTKCYHSTEFIHEVLNKLETDGSKLLLFLTNVRKLTVTEYTSDGALPKLRLVIERIDKQIDNKCKLTIITNGSTAETWLVVNSQKETILTASVACQLKLIGNCFEVKKVEGEMFCFLPLGFIKTGLPIHVSANFAVLNNRRGIWVSDLQIPTEQEVTWNRKLMRGPIPTAYFHLLQVLRNFSMQNQLSNYVFHLLWPNKQCLANENPWKFLLETLYELVVIDKLFQTISLTKWLKLSDSQLLCDPILCPYNMATPSCVLETLEIFRNEHIVHLPCNEIACTVTFKPFTEVDFVSVFFKNIHTVTNFELRNAVLLCILESYAFIMDDRKRKRDQIVIKSLLQNNQCIPCSPDGIALKHVTEAVDSSSKVAVLFDMDDQRFPASSFMESPSCYRAMTSLGLLCKSLPHDILVTCATKTENKPVDIEKVKIILQCLSLLSDMPEHSELRNISFLPVLKKPENFFIHWKGKEEVLPPCQLKHGKDLPNLVGSQVCILDCASLGNAIDDNIIDLLGCNYIPDVSTVIKQLEELIQFASTADEEAKYDFITNLFESIFSFFNDLISSQEIPDTWCNVMSTLKCIWTGKLFVSPSNIAKNWKTEGRILFPIPHSLTNKYAVLDCLGVSDSFDALKLFSALEDLSNLNNTSVLLYDGHVREIISELDKFESDVLECTSVYLPNEKYQMCHVSRLVYKDVSWATTKDHSLNFIHDMISSSLASKLKVRSVRQCLLEKYGTSFGEEFGQYEDLTVRINNILRDYPFDVTFLKELIQNADDAQATKVVFILDKRTHGTEKVFTDNWKELQGPALLVWNDSVFEEKDLIGIQRLGYGQKRGSSDTIGTFGIGFNVVYHITDCPSFITGGNTLCIFDPLGKYVIPTIPTIHEVKCSGTRYNNISDGSFKKDFSDVVASFTLNKCFNEKGTLFRLPFRKGCGSKILNPTFDADQQDSSAIDSEYSSNADIITIDDMREKFDDWASDIQMLLLFLTNVHCLEFHVMEENRKMKLLMRFNASCDKTKREQYREACSNFSKCKLPKVVQYPLCCQQEINGKIKSTTWLVQQGIGDLDNGDANWKFSPLLKPRHGIAAQINPPVRTHFRGKLFCFLPLPVCTDIPVHLNGQFILSSSRRDIWRSTSTTNDDNTEWNNSIIKALASSYANFLQEIVSHDELVLNNKSNERIIFQKKYNNDDIQNLKNDVSQYYWLFPTQRKFAEGNNSTAIPVPSGEWKVFANAVFAKLHSKNAKILASVGTSPSVFANPNFKVDWSVLHNEHDLANQSYFFYVQESDDIYEALKRIGMNLNIAPKQVWKGFNKELPIVNECSVYHYCRNFCCENLPLPLNKTKFKVIKTLLTILKYILTRTEGSFKFPSIISTWPHNSPFLLTANEQLCNFDIANPIICSKYSELFPNSCNHFLHPKLVALGMDKDYFYDPNKDDASKDGDLFLNIISKALPTEFRSRVHFPMYTKVISKDKLMKFLKCFCVELPPDCLKKVLSHWALIPSDKEELFAGPKELNLLPILKLNLTDDKIQNSASDIEQDCKVFDVLKNIGLPVLDLSIFTTTTEEQKLNLDVDVIKALNCPLLSDPTDILHNLVLFSKKEILDYMKNNKECLGILLGYLGAINFKIEDHMKDIISLPVFETVTNTLCCLSNKRTYIWPCGFPVNGVLKILSYWDTSIFLNSKGLWKKLGDKDILQIQELSPSFLYREFIFPYFSILEECERLIHLEYIKNHLIDVCIAKKEKRFLDAIKNLPAIADQQGLLRRAADFFDHSVKVFELFESKSHLPEKFRDDEWVGFFKKTGLVCYVSEASFIEYCYQLQRGEHSDVRAASKSLLHYLLKAISLNRQHECPWKNPILVLKKVASIKFIVIKYSKEHDNICKQCMDTLRFCGDCHMTSLQNAATFDVVDLLWTVKDIIEIPTHYLQNLHFMEILNGCCKISTRNFICRDDVLQNLKNICSSKSESSFLFDLIIKHFNFLAKHQTEFVNKECSSLKCIPVKIGEKVNLVNPSFVVDDPIANRLHPFLYCLDENIKSVPLTFLQNIGISMEITYRHCALVLREMSNVRNLQSDDNTKLRTILECLYKLTCLSLPTERDLNPLYLPDINKNLLESKLLLYCDDERFIGCNFNTTQDMSVLCLPDITSPQGTISRSEFEKHLCTTLPKSVRPIYVSSCNWKLSDGVEHCHEPNELKSILEFSFNHCMLQYTLETISNKVTCDTSKKIIQNIQEMICKARVYCVKDLVVDVFNNDDQHLCSSTHFKCFFQKQTCAVYIDSSVELFDSHIMVFSPLSMDILKAALLEGEMPSELEEFQKIFPLLVEAHEQSHFERIFQLLNLDFDNASEDHPKPRPDIAEGLRWLKQSEVDLRACKELKSAMLSDQTLAGYVCFLAHQVAEKSLKGAMFAIYGEADLLHHHIMPMAMKLDCENTSSFTSVAQQLNNYYTKTRYPNTCCPPTIPADKYTPGHAYKALEAASYIFDEVTSLITPSD